MRLSAARREGLRPINLIARRSGTDIRPQGDYFYPSLAVYHSGIQVGNFATIVLITYQPSGGCRSSWGITP